MRLDLYEVRQRIGIVPLLVALAVTAFFALVLIGWLMDTLYRAVTGHPLNFPP